nr:MAG TPA: hypothetical protein [Crassvirales sp.]
MFIKKLMALIHVMVYIPFKKRNERNLETD